MDQVMEKRRRRQISLEVDLWEVSFRGSATWMDVVIWFIGKERRYLAEYPSLGNCNSNSGHEFLCKSSMSISAYALLHWVSV